MGAAGLGGAVELSGGSVYPVVEGAQKIWVPPTVKGSPVVWGNPVDLGSPWCGGAQEIQEPHSEMGTGDPLACGCPGASGTPLVMGNPGELGTPW